MKKIGYYYYLQNRSYNYTPAKLTKIEDNILHFDNLLIEQKIKIEQNIYREIGIEAVHLDRIGFKNEKHKDIYCHAIYAILGNDLTDMTRAFFGYYVFHKDDVTKIQNSKNNLVNTINKKFQEDPKYLYSSDEIRNNFNTIFTINELFEKLDKFNLEIGNKDEIITG